MSDLQTLYQELIIDHGTDPRNHYELSPCTHQAEGYNPLCGDQIKLFINLDPKTKIIQEISFTGSGCAISIASASLLTDTLKQKNITDTQKILSDLFNQLIPKSNTTQSSAKLPEKLNALMGVRAFPTRIKCVTLAWHAVEDALSREHAKTIPITLKKITDPNQFEPEIHNAGDPRLTDLIIKGLKTIFDPELPVNIYDLGLINAIYISPDHHIEIKLTLTTPGCPVAQTFPTEIKKKLSEQARHAEWDLKDIQVTLTWDPPWSPARLSDGVKLQLGLL